VSRIALIGIPFISGFYSKDAIIEYTIDSKLISILIIIIIITIGITAIYTIRIFKFSIKFILKTKRDRVFYNRIKIELPLIIITPYSIFIGTLII